MKKVISFIVILLIAAGIAGAIYLSQETKKDQSAESSSAATTSSDTTKIWVHPNQLAASLWYKPKGSVINGHIDGSYSNFTNWSNLLTKMKQVKAGFGIYASEIGHTNSSFFEKLTQESVPLSVELPGMTQCLTGSDIANAELNGEPLSTRSDIDFFNSIFTISSTDRNDPHSSGWFVSKDAKDIIPDEIVFDHRVLQLGGLFVEADKFSTTEGSWEERISANDRSTCTLYPKDNFDARISGYIEDYVKYINLAKEKWEDNMPKVSVHWAVSPWWEWSDEKCLDYNHNLGENYTDPKVLLELKKPCYNSVTYLEKLVELLCNNDTCPSTIYFDVDWFYNTAYSVEVLKRHKNSINDLSSRFNTNIYFGIDLVDVCDNENLQCVLKVEDTNLSKVTGTDSPNKLYQETVLKLYDFIIGNNIFSPITDVIRIQSWSIRPIEKVEQTSESVQYSFAETAKLIIEKINPSKITSAVCSSQDLNSDGKISLVDLSSLLSKYNTSCEVSDEDYGVCGSQDSNNDGEISLVDLSNLLSKYNKSCE